MNIKLVHWLVKLGLNKIDSQTFTDVTPNIIDEELNKCQLTLIRDKLRTNQGFEFNRLIKTDLSSLVILGENITTNSNQIKFQDLEYPLLHFIRAELLVEKDDCSKVIPVYEKQFDDRSRTNAIQESSFKWERAIGFIAKDTTTDSNAALFIDKPDFLIQEAYIDYLRYPKEVCLGGYNDIDNNPKLTEEFEFGNDMINQIIDLCVFNLAAKLDYQDAKMKYEMSQLSKIT